MREKTPCIRFVCGMQLRYQDHLFYSCYCSLVTIYILLPTSSILIRNGLSSLWTSKLKQSSNMMGPVRTGPIMFELFEILVICISSTHTSKMEDIMKRLRRWGWSKPLASEMHRCKEEHPRNFYRHVKQLCCSKCNLCNLSSAAIPYAPPKLFKMHVIVTIHCAWERGGNSTPLSIKSCKTQTYSLLYMFVVLGDVGGLPHFKPCKTPKR